MYHIYKIDEDENDEDDEDYIKNVNASDIGKNDVCYIYKDEIIRVINNYSSPIIINLTTLIYPTKNYVFQYEKSLSIKICKSLYLEPPIECLIPSSYIPEKNFYIRNNTSITGHLKCLESSGENNIYSESKIEISKSCKLSFYTKCFNTLKIKNFYTYINIEILIYKSNITIKYGTHFEKSKLSVNISCCDKNIVIIRIDEDD